MRLSPNAFNRMLNGVGQQFGWRKSYACPCVNRNSGQAQPNCPHCAGKGRMWDAAIEGMAGIVSRDQMKNFAQFGLWDQGDVMLSIPSDSPLYELGLFDRVAAKNRTEPFSMNMVRGMNDLLKLPVVEIDRVMWLNAQNQIQDAEIPTVSAAGVLQWRGNPPPMGSTYSVTGRRHQEFFVYQEVPFDRPMHSGAKLPRRVVIRRFDLFGR